MIKIRDEDFEHLDGNIPSSIPCGTNGICYWHLNIVHALFWISGRIENQRNVPSEDYFGIGEYFWIFGSFDFLFTRVSSHRKVVEKTAAHPAP